MEKIVAMEIKGKGITGSERHLAEPCLDNAGICRHRGHQRRKPCIAHGDGALIDNSGIRYGRRNNETKIARHEIRIRDVGGGGDQAAHVHPGAGSEEDTVGVDQHHVAVGGHGAENT